MSDSLGKRTIKVRDLGLTDYKKAHHLQQQLQAERMRGEGEDTLLLTEHQPVFTLGRKHPKPNLRTTDEIVKAAGIEVAQTERGGDITYHGPGQLVAYGIIDLRQWGIGVVDYVEALENTMFGVLEEWGVEGHRHECARGAWVGEKKVGSVGLHVRRFVSMHGAALNVAPNMGHIALMNPCGLENTEMTSLSAEAGRAISVAEVAEAFVRQFGRLLECETTGGTTTASSNGIADL
ncbi:MAG: octanoyltransferase [Dehalococcoidia bacterium]|nr:octanoyltransferase [Dehalococcoidia bacterium]HCV00070.1 octanoyltransferase [Dehalococcoidia bacterium]|tara:strand:+ start:1148 stop:1852 length:705 start_codon:yes stop_codon:yes gene_type:complete